MLVARRVLPAPDAWVESGGVLVVDGTVRRVLPGLASVRRAARAEGRAPVDLGDGLVAPGLVCAHAHLELSFLAGRVAPGLAMVDWVGAVLELRGASSARERRRAALAAADALAAGGTTLVGDVQSPEPEADSLAPRTGSALEGPPLAIRRVAFREVLDAGDPGRRAAALASLRRALPRRALRREGVSPHGPHTASPELLREVARVVSSRGIPVQLHWSESEAELDWLLRSSGPFRALLGESPRASGLDLVERAGLLGPRTSLVHGNHPGRGEIARIARAGSAVVHCPGSHAFFARAPFPLERYRRAGVTLALGTDSLASNDALDMRREMQLLRAARPGLSPQAVWAMATVGGARALGVEGRAGVLGPGAWADLVCFDTDGDGPRAALDRLTASSPRVESVWIGGRRVRLAADSS